MYVCCFFFFSFVLSQTTLVFKYVYHYLYLYNDHCVILCAQLCHFILFYIFTNYNKTRRKNEFYKNGIITDIKTNFPFGIRTGDLWRARPSPYRCSYGDSWQLGGNLIPINASSDNCGCYTGYGWTNIRDRWAEEKTITRELWHFVLYYYHSCIFVVLGKMLISVLVLELSEEKKKNLENVYIEPYIWFRILPKYDFNNKYLLTHS